MKWNDVKLYQFNKLQELLRIENDEERLVEICSLFFEKDVLELPLTEFKQKVKELDFLKEDIPSNIPPKKITVNGKKYYFDCLLGNITTAQYVDFINYSKTNDIVKIMSVFLIPEGHKYNDGSYDIADVINDIYELPITVVNDAAFFFRQTVQQIHGNFPILFNQEPKETETEQGSREATNQGNEVFNGFGIIPFILKFCEVTNHNFEEAMNYDVSTLFYIVSYEVIKMKEQEKQIKQMQRRNGSNR